MDTEDPVQAEPPMLDAGGPRHERRPSRLRSALALVRQASLGNAVPSWLRRPLARLMLRKDVVTLADGLQAGVAERRDLIRDGPPPTWTVAEAIDALQSARQAPTMLGTIRLLLAAFPGRQGPGKAVRADLEAVRIDHEVLMGFQPVEVTRIAMLDGPNARVAVSQAALGLLGPSGPMPIAWTEFALGMPASDEDRGKGNSFIAFTNILQRRQLGLFYRAWAEAQVVCSLDGGDDAHPIADRLQALAGVVLGDTLERDTVPGSFKLAFASVLSRRVRSPVALEYMLSSYFELPVKIVEFIPRWMPIPTDQQSTLGLGFSTLGVDAIAGAQVWDCASTFRISIGPMSLERYRDFLPGARSHQELQDLAALYCGPEWQWEISPILKNDEVPYSWLGNAGLLLGWSSWLGVRYEDAHAEDLQMLTQPQLQSPSMPEPDIVLAD